MSAIAWFALPADDTNRAQGDAFALFQPAVVS